MSKAASLYQLIHDDIYKKIAEGEYRDGDKLPSEKELAAFYDVSLITIRKAVEMLEEREYVHRIAGKGTFVTLENDIPSIQVMKTKKTKSIGVIFCNIASCFGLDIFAAIEEEASKKGINIIFKRSFDSQERESELIQQMIEDGVDGIIIQPVHGETYNQEILRQSLKEFPMVLIDRNLEGLSLPFVGTDNLLAAKIATQYMVDLGHRDISFMSTPPKGTSSVEHRIEGMIECLTENGITLDRSLWLTDILSPQSENGSFEEIVESDITKISQHLIENPEITCIFASEYFIAQLVFEASKIVKRKIPDELSVICFDAPQDYIGRPSFTHMRQMQRDIGITAFQMICNYKDTLAAKCKYNLSSQLVAGRSTKRLAQPVAHLKQTEK